MSRRASEPSERVAAILEPTARTSPIDLPSTLTRGRYGVSRRATLGVLLVVFVALAVLGGRYFLARQDAAPEPVGTVEQAGDRAPFAEVPAPTGPDAPTGAATTPAEVTVHVVGQVKRPGIVTLPAGSRVAEALDSAGGTSSTADLAGVNLARVLVDGEQVLVPKPGERPAPEAAAPGAPSGAAAPVNLNTADLTTLETLPGVGPVLAQRILDWRTEHGRFTTVDELGEVSGVGEKTFAQLSPKVTV